MISILVPVFNNRVFELINSLSEQLRASDFKGEIIVLDDASDQEFLSHNEKIRNLPFVKYDLLTNNSGRILIRKELANRALFPWLLFIDGDSKLNSDRYLLNYLSSLNKDNDVITGGRIYSSIRPTECIKMLHWKYGTKRENIFNNKTGFQTNNFCIKKEVFNKLAFNENISGYGHEDTLLGIYLDQLGIKITKINNPVIHEGVEDADVYIEKSKNALMNLYILSQTINKKLLKKNTKIYYWFSIILFFHLRGIILFLYRKFNKYILKNLHSCKPNLLLFDLLRLSYLLNYSKFSKKTDL